jgi:Flp pilus assembly CpaE family ATPase
MIYKTILEVFSDNVSDSIGIKFDSDSNVRIITFVSASGGAGSSSSAAACAKSFAASGQKTLYLNLEQFGSVEPFFSGAGQTDFSDVIFALKSKKTNLSLKLESNVRQDPSGVSFYASPKKALDMMELKTEEVQKLITDLKLTGSYDSIVFDIDFSFNASAMEIFKQSTAIVFVSDGSEISNIKFMRAYNAIEILDERADVPLLPRLAVFYNKFSNKTGKTLDDVARSIGGAPKYDHATTEQVISQLVGLGVFQKI